MQIQIKSLEHPNSFTYKQEIKSSNDLKDVIYYALRTHFRKDVEIGNSIIQTPENKHNHNYNYFSIVKVSYMKLVEEPSEIINLKEPNKKDFYKKLVHIKIEENIRIQIKVEKNELKKDLFSKLKNLKFKFKLFLINNFSWYFLFFN